MIDMKDIVNQYNRSNTNDSIQVIDILKNQLDITKISTYCSYSDSQCILIVEYTNESDLSMITRRLIKLGLYVYAVSHNDVIGTNTIKLRKI